MILSLIGIAVFLAPMILISILLLLTGQPSVIFRQKRYGKNKKLFTIYKFRTMKKNAPKDVPTHSFEGATTYITRFGRFLRRTSLDELPQLFNILFGQMSIIGPRPVVYTETDQIAERDKYDANNIRPGLTGLAQIRGRDNVNIFDKARYDGEYYQKISLWLDIKIFFVTVFQVFAGRGVREGKLDTPPVHVTPEDIARVEAVYDNEVNIKYEKGAQADAPTDTEGGQEGLADGQEGLTADRGDLTATQAAVAQVDLTDGQEDLPPAASDNAAAPARGKNTAADSYSDLLAAVAGAAVPDIAVPAVPADGACGDGGQNAVLDLGGKGKAHAARDIARGDKEQV